MHSFDSGADHDSRASALEAARAIHGAGVASVRVQPTSDVVHGCGSAYAAHDGDKMPIDSEIASQQTADCRPRRVGTARRNLLRSCLGAAAARVPSEGDGHHGQHGSMVAAGAQAKGTSGGLKPLHGMHHMPCSARPVGLFVLSHCGRAGRNGATTAGPPAWPIPSVPTVAVSDWVQNGRPRS